MSILGCLYIGGYRKKRLDNGSRVNREIYARFCERLRGKFPRSTHHQSGFALWYKRLEAARFHWPRSWPEAVIELREEQLQWLLAGYDITRLQPHKLLHYSRVL